jgi:hypothetical protein
MSTAPTGWNQIAKPRALACPTVAAVVGFVCVWGSDAPTTATRLNKSKTTGAAISEFLCIRYSSWG